MSSEQDPGLSLALDADGHLATLTLSRPGNRFSLALMRRFREVLEQLSRAETLRVVLLRTEGPHFSYGADLRDPDLAEHMMSPEGRRKVATLGGDILDAWCQLPVPTVVAANGHTMGAGGCFFVGADFRYAGPTFRLHFPEVDRGMSLGWGLLPRLAREFGWPLARRLALGGESLPREAFPAAVTAADDADAAAADFARALSRKPPLAVRSVTRVLRARDRQDAALAADDVAAFVETAGSEDFLEAIAAWMERRDGAYQGR